MAAKRPATRRPNPAASPVAALLSPPSVPVGEAGAVVVTVVGEEVEVTGFPDCKPVLVVPGIVVVIT